MEKRGVIEPGRTPPEKPAKEKKAATPTPQQLEQDPTRRLADRVADETKADKQ